MRARLASAMGPRKSGGFESGRVTYPLSRLDEIISDTLSRSSDVEAIFARMRS